MNKIRSPVIDLLIAFRDRHGWSQSECARRIGITARSLRSWEQGLRHPKPIVLRALRDFMKRHPEN